MSETISLVPIVANFTSPIQNYPIKYVGLDRDNTLIEDAGYTKLDQEPNWLPTVIDGLRLIHSLELELVIFTNQAALTKGIFDLPRLEDFHRRMNLSLLKEAGFGFHSIIICPHLQDQGCSCRKPLPGMFQVAREIFGELPRVMIGDSESDVLAAKSANVLALKTSQGDFLTVVSDWLRNSC